MRISVKCPSDPASIYADLVLRRKIPAGEFVRAACLRHFSDLECGHKRGLTFDRDAAEKAVKFFPSVLTVTEGMSEGKPFELLDWHKFCAASMFGWKRSDGLRRFRQVWLETGKGQAKSPFMGAIGLYLGGFVGKRRPELYAIASDRDQANVLFRDAVAMCRAPIVGYDEDQTLESEGYVIIRGTGDNAWKIEFPHTQGKFQSMASGDAISGPRPYAVFADEIHEMKTPKALQLWKAAIDKMSGDPVMILGTNTPASDQIVGTQYSEMAQRIVTGVSQDDATFAFIARVDKDDDPLNDPSCWEKSLPALGKTFPRDNVITRVEQAKLLLSEELATKRLYFGIPVGSTEFWIVESSWNAVQGEFNEEDMIGLECWLSLDLSKKNDLTALTIVWRRPDGHMFMKTYYFTTKLHLADRERDDGVPYSLWVAQGFLTATPGAVIDLEFVAHKVKELYENHNVKAMAYDAAKIGDFMDAAAEVGLDCWRFKGPEEPYGDGLMILSHGQGTRVLFKEGALSMPNSIQHFEDAILNKTITIEKSPVSQMCAANACVVADPMNNRAFDKKRSRGRIDGIVTMAMAVGVAVSQIEDGAPLDDFLNNPVRTR